MPQRKASDTVVFPNVNDGIWPNSNAKIPAELEAERRACYVAFTRSQSMLVLQLSIGSGAGRPSTRRISVSWAIGGYKDNFLWDDGRPLRGYRAGLVPGYLRSNWTS